MQHRGAWVANPNRLGSDRNLGASQFLTQRP